MYRTMITIEVLSEDPIEGDMDIAEIVDEMTTGDYSGLVMEVQCVGPIDRRQMALRLLAHNSDPGFLLGEDGWKYGLHPGDEVSIDGGDNEDHGSVLIQSIDYVVAPADDSSSDSAVIVTTDGERIECLIKEIS